MYKKTTIIVKTVCYLYVLYDSFFLKSVNDPKPFIILFLILVLNHQVRWHVVSKKCKLISIVVDLIIIICFYSYYKNASALLLFIPFIDALYFFPSYDISTLSTFIILYTSLQIIHLRQYADIVWILLIAILIYGLARQFRHIIELQYLYDDVTRYSYELENAKKRIEAYTHQVAHLAHIQERNQISETLHDTVGHQLTATLLHLEAGVYTLDKNPLQGKAMIKQTVNLLRNSIETMRKTLKHIKQLHYVSLKDSVDKLTTSFEHTTGIKTIFETYGTGRQLDATIETAIYQNIQEALTNCARHAQASHIKIKMTYEHKNIKVEINDNGMGCTNITDGMGLTGIRKRLQLINGDLKISGRAGFRITFIIPYQEEEIV